MPIRSDHLLGGIQVDAGTLHRFSRNIEIHSSHNPLSFCGGRFWIWFGRMLDLYESGEPMDNEELH